MERESILLTAHISLSLLRARVMSPEVAMLYDAAYSCRECVYVCVSKCERLPESEREERGGGEREER